jgi:hypothetical protein
MSRSITTDFQRQNINLRFELANDIIKYLKESENSNDMTGFLLRHENQDEDIMIDATMRARMVDWMIEVLTNFKCDD